MNDNETPKTFDLKPGETAVVQLANGDELELACTETTGTKATLSIAPADAVKRVMKLVK